MSRSSDLALEVLIHEAEKVMKEITNDLVAKCYVVEMEGRHLENGALRIEKLETLIDDFVRQNPRSGATQ